MKVSTSKKLLVAITASTVFAACNMYGNEKKLSPMEKEMEDAIQSVDAPTVLPPRLDADGNIKGLWIVGVGTMYKSLPASIRLQKAADQAKSSARKALAMYMNTHVKFGKNEKQELLIKAKGNSEGENEGSSQQESNFTELTTNEQKEMSQAIINGLMQIRKSKTANGDYAVLMAWNAASSAFAAQVSKIMGKNARIAINEAKAAEGAYLQDPNAAYQRANSKDANEKTKSSGSSKHKSPQIKSKTSPGAEFFF